MLIPNYWLTLGSIGIVMEFEDRLISEFCPSWLLLLISISKSDCGTGMGPSLSPVLSNSEHNYTEHSFSIYLHCSLGTCNRTK